MSKKLKNEESSSDDSSENSSSQESRNRSSSSSSSSSQSSSESEQQQQVQQKFKRQWEESDSEEEEKRVVKTQAQKRVEKMREIILKIKDKIKNRDFNQLHDLYEELNKELIKNKIFFDKEGIPKMYIYYVWYLEQFCKILPPEDKKKLSTTNNKSFNTLKQKLKKNRVNHLVEIEKCEANPKEYYDSEKENSANKKESSESEQEKKKKQDKKQKQKKQKDNDETDSWDEKQESSSESDEEDEIEDMKKYRQSNDPMIRRKYWLKKSVLFPNKYKESSESSEIDSEEERKNKEERKKQKDEEKRRKEEQLETQQFNVVHTEIREVNVKDNAEVEKFMIEISENKAKVKTQGKQFYFDVLTKYIDSFSDTKRLIETIMLLLPLSVDLGKQIQPTHMPRNIWVKVLEVLDNLLVLVKDKKASELQIQTFAPLYKKEGDKEVEIIFESEEQEIAYKYHSHEHIQSQLVTFVVILEFELYKSFKVVEYTAAEYNQRIGDMYRFLKLCKQAQDFYEKKNDFESATKIAMKRLQNIYYIHDSTLEKLRNSAKAAKKSTADEFYNVTDSEQLVNDLCALIYQYNGNNKVEVFQAVLFQMYHHAIHDRPQKALDLLLIGHINELVQNTSSPFYIHYVRFIVQQGMAYFRLGQIKEANIYLKEIFIQKHKLREVLRQQIGRSVNIEDKKKTLPYHMHINLETVETINSIVGLLLDTPSVLIHEKKNPLTLKLKNYQFRAFIESFTKDPGFVTDKQIKMINKAAFTGPSEHNGEFVFSAFKSISKGEWREAFDELVKLNIWTNMHNKEQVLEKLKKNVKQIALKCYIIIYRNVLESLRLKDLADKYELPVNKIKTITSKLIVKKKIMANLQGNEQDNYLVFEQSQKTKQQYLGDKLLEKVGELVIQNEEVLFQGNKKEENDLNNQDKQNKPQYYNQNRRKKEHVQISQDYQKRGKKQYNKKNY